MKDPTPAFLESEERSKKFAAKQKKLKKAMNSLLDELNAGVDDNDAIEALRKMTILIQAEQVRGGGREGRCSRSLTLPDSPDPQDLPQGMNKESLIKSIRLKKTAMTSKVGVRHWLAARALSPLTSHSRHKSPGRLGHTR